MYVTLIENNNYEIFDEEPFQIRKKSNKRILKESLAAGGKYYRVKLNGVDYYKHRLIAQQFIENPNNYDEIDHIDRNTKNNSIDNIRWVSPSDNSKNKTSARGIEYEFVDTIPKTSRSIFKINNHKFRQYYFDADFNVYFCNGVQFRKLYVNSKNKISLRDINNKPVQITIDRLRTLMDSC